MKLLLKYPSRQRPKIFVEMLDKYYALLSGQHEYEFIISLDNDDPTMNNQPMINYLSSKPNLKYYFGNSKCKVQAINADMTGHQFDVLLLISDDMMPLVQGYDDIIMTDMMKRFSDLSGVLHYNDGRVGRKLNTLSIMGKKIYDDWGYIYHPDYVSLWCDNEFQAASEACGKSAYIDKVIIKHVWENHNDALRKKNEAYYRSDRETFYARQAAGFPKHSVLPIR